MPRVARLKCEICGKEFYENTDHMDFCKKRKARKEYNEKKKEELKKNEKATK